jgi:hypothetical protein
MPSALSPGGGHTPDRLHPLRHWDGRCRRRNFFRLRELGRCRPLHRHRSDPGNGHLRKRWLCRLAALIGPRRGRVVLPTFAVRRLLATADSRHLSFARRSEAGERGDVVALDHHVRRRGSNGFGHLGRGAVEPEPVADPADRQPHGRADAEDGNGVTPVGAPRTRRNRMNRTPRRGLSGPDRNPVHLGVPDGSWNPEQLLLGERSHPTELLRLLTLHRNPPHGMCSIHRQ